MGPELSPRPSTAAGAGSIIETLLPSREKQ
jgi:hypothetical protein